MASSGSRGVFVKLALRFAISLTFTAAFAYASSVSSFNYFTTWALVMHTAYFFSFAVCDAGFVRDDTKHLVLFKIGMPIGSGVAIAVAASVTYLISVNWEDMYDEYCQEAQACLDLSLEFVAAHFVPPLAYFIAFILKGEPPKAIAPQLRWFVRWNLLFQAILVPTTIYTQIFDIDKTYGQGSQLGAVLIYWAAALMWSLAWILNQN